MRKQQSEFCCLWDRRCREMLKRQCIERTGGRGVAYSAPVKHKLDLNFAPIWIPAPESNPADVKGEGTRKNNMEITWTVRVPALPSTGLHTWPWVPEAIGWLRPPGWFGSHSSRCWASRSQTGTRLRVRFKTGDRSRGALGTEPANLAESEYQQNKVGFSRRRG